jgi:transcriptional antiterminator RfaH
MLNLWYALFVRPKYEFRCEEILRAKGYETYVPYCNAPVSRPKTNRKMLSVPLLPGYVFSRFSESAFGRMVTTPGVIRIVGFGRRPAAIDEQELAAVRRVAESNLLCEPWQNIPVGCPVEIVTGPLAGVTGTLLNCGDRKLIVSITFLQRSIAATLDVETKLTVRSLPSDAHVSASASLPIAGAFIGRPESA